MHYTTTRFIRLTAMLATGLITFANYKFAMAYPTVTVTGKDGKTRVCNTASRVQSAPIQV